MWQRHGTCTGFADQNAYLDFAVAAARKFDADVRPFWGGGGSRFAAAVRGATASGGLKGRKGLRRWWSGMVQTPSLACTAFHHTARLADCPWCPQALFRPLNCTTGFDAAALRQQLKTAWGADPWLVCNAA